MDNPWVAVFFVPPQYFEQFLFNFAVDKIFRKTQAFLLRINLV